MTENQMIEEVAADLQLEIMGTEIDVDICEAAEVIIAFFERLQDKARWKLWLRVIYAGAIRALRTLLWLRCGR